MTDEVERQSELLRHMRILRRADVRDVIAAFGGLRPMANKMGVAVSTVQGWKDRKKFPDNRLGPIIQKMKEVGIQIEALDPTPEMDPTYKPESESSTSDAHSSDSKSSESKSTDIKIDDVISRDENVNKDPHEAKPFGGVLEEDRAEDVTTNQSQSSQSHINQDNATGSNPYEQVQAQALHQAQNQDKRSFAKKLKSWAVTTAFGMVLGIGGLLWMDGYFDNKNPSVATAKITQDNRRVVFVDENNKPVKNMMDNTPKTSNATGNSKGQGNKAIDMFSRQSYEKDISEMFMQNRELLGRVQMLQDRLDAMLAQPVVEVETVGKLRDDLIRAQQNETVLKNKITALESRLYDFETRLLDQTSEQELWVQQKLTEMLKRISENSKGEKNGAGQSAQALWLNQTLLVVGNVQAGSETGRPFMAQAEQLAYMFKGENTLKETIATIHDIAKTGVYSVGHISNAMMQQLPQLQQAYARPEKVETWFDFAKSMMARVFTIRRVAADAPGTSPVTQIEVALAKNDLQTVVDILQANPKIKRGMGDLFYALEDRLLYDKSMTVIHAYLKRRMQETYDEMAAEQALSGNAN